jgi:hypothetical protein
MSASIASHKRKKRSKNNASLREDDADAMDTVTHMNKVVNTKSGPKRKRIKVPLIPTSPGVDTSNHMEDMGIPMDSDIQDHVADDPVSQPYVGMVRINASPNWLTKQYS